jgi:hypothetical protein
VAQDADFPASAPRGETIDPRLQTLACSTAVLRTDERVDSQRRLWPWIEEKPMRSKRIAGAVSLFLVAGLSLIAVACGFVSGSGNVISRDLDLSGFTRVEIQDSFEVSVTEAPDFGVTIRLDDNIEQYLQAEVDGDTLSVGLDGAMSYNDVTLEAEIRLPKLAELELSGASDGRLSGFNDLEPLDVGLSGSSTLQVVDLRSAAADLDLSGASELDGTWVMTDGRISLSGSSEVRLTGAVDALWLDLSGSSTAELARFRAERLEVDMSGSSDGTVLVTDTLDADLSGASTLEYLGDPSLGRVETSGSSEVRPAE